MAVLAVSAYLWAVNWFIKRDYQIHTLPSNFRSDFCSLRETVQPLSHFPSGNIIVLHQLEALSHFRPFSFLDRGIYQRLSHSYHTMSYRGDRGRGRGGFPPSNRGSTDRGGRGGGRGRGGGGGREQGG